MKHLLILAVHLLATIAKLVRPGGVRAVVAESLLLKHQLLISSRARRRAPNLNSVDRLLLGLGSLFVSPSRTPKLAVILKPRTLFRFHAALKKCKYRWLFSSGGHRRPGPKGPSKELIEAILELAKHGSWLNLVEGFFSKLARSVLRHIRVASKQELKDRLMAAIDYFNQNAVVHTWTYKLDKAA